MFEDMEKELKELSDVYKKQGIWKVPTRIEAHAISQSVNKQAYEVLKDQLPPVLTSILKDDNVYKYQEMYAIGAISHLFAGYAMVMEERVKELEAKIAKLENQVNEGKQKGE